MYCTCSAPRDDVLIDNSQLVLSTQLKLQCMIRCYLSAQYVAEADCPVPIPSHYVPNGTLAANFREGHQWYNNEIQAKIAHSLQTPRTARTVQTHKIVSLQTCIGPPTCRYWKVEWEAVPNEQPPSGENVEALLEAESWVHEIAIKGTIAQ